MSKSKTPKQSTKKAKPIEAVKPYSITVQWNGKEGEGQSFQMAFEPGLELQETDIRKHLVLLANAFATGTRQLMNFIKPLPQPTEQELKDQTYDFGAHGEEYGEELFGLYTYKKAMMEEFVSIVERALPDAFHDVLFVKGVQEKIFEQMREKHLNKVEETSNDEYKGDN